MMPPAALCPLATRRCRNIEVRHAEKIEQQFLHILHLNYLLPSCRNKVISGFHDLVASLAISAL